MPSLRRGSHRRISVRCEFRLVPKCRGEWSIEERLANETRARNGGRIICMYCSRRVKATGHGNPNHRYTFDQTWFSTVDSELKAYFLGWIASDGAISRGSIALYVHRKDIATLTTLRDAFCPALPVKAKRNRDLVGFTINSISIVDDVCRWLEIQPGKKDATVSFPRLTEPRLAWAFLRGFFDGDGSISSVDAAGRRREWPAPRCSIASTSSRMLEAIRTFVGIPCHRGKQVIEWNGANALDFLGRLYDGAAIALTRKRDLYLDWCNWSPGLSGSSTRGRDAFFRWMKTVPEAVPPTKRSASDSGFDLTLIARDRRHGNVEFFRTGIRVQPEFGWYFDLVPRSSISKSGYMLANSVGVIDRGYTGEILVPLVKSDPDAPPLALPARLVQIIPRPIIAAQLVEVDSLDETERGGGGFGSTGPTGG